MIYNLLVSVDKTRLECFKSYWIQETEPEGNN